MVRLFVVKGSLGVFGITVRVVSCVFEGTVRDVGVVRWVFEGVLCLLLDGVLRV